MSLKCLENSCIDFSTVSAALWLARNWISNPRVIATSLILYTVFITDATSSEALTRTKAVVLNFYKQNHGGFATDHI